MTITTNDPELGERTAVVAKSESYARRAAPSAVNDSFCAVKRINISDPFSLVLGTSCATGPVGY